MDRLGKVRLILSACVSTNPDLMRRFEEDSTLILKAEQIRRSDVVAALLLDRSARRWERNLADLDHWWDLRHDDLASQSDECIGFTYDRLRSSQS